MQSEIERSILKTLAYSDIFNYPLTEDEIWSFLINNKIIDKNLIGNYLSSHVKYKNSKTVFNKGFYCFKKNKNIVNGRIKREKESNKKLIIAKKIISILSFIPTIQLIGISGALSMNNCDKDDDIDLFVITNKNSLWITRFFLLLILQFLNKRRKRFDNKTKDKICLNLLIDESRIAFKKERHDLYTAHEIVQMIPIFEKNNMYEKFIKSNIWVKKFLANSIKYRANKNYMQKNTETVFSVVLCFIFRICALERLAKHFQHWYMKNHITSETVSDHILAFHPIDQREKTLSLYNKNLEKYKI